MARSSTTSAKTSSSEEASLQTIHEGLANVCELLAQLIHIQERREREERILTNAVRELKELLDGFTDSGSSFRAYQPDPTLHAYAAILGPILGDRIDSQFDPKLPDGSKADYLDYMMKGSAVMARRLLRTLDEYNSQRSGLDYLETMASDISEPGENPPPAV